MLQVATWLLNRALQLKWREGGGVTPATTHFRRKGLNKYTYIYHIYHIISINGSLI